ncbi:Ribonuclease H2 subunit B [Frankliniella fusca]|uniref:Ribonuclease H2 subunit B n=1 Tax=Frankliniella fusca TaxID=407009 RepID=A0AAE1GY40_9NEOP|nr:Ribonuclease H2 subunit B [Frankliniella fusca]
MCVKIGKMVVTKPQKLARSSAVNSKCTKVHRKSGLKKILLKAAARNMIVIPDKQSNGLRKKVVCVKKRCHIARKRKQRLPSCTAEVSKDRVSSWLKNQVVENPQDQPSEPVSFVDGDIQGSDLKIKTPSKEDSENNVISQSISPSKVALQNSPVNLLKDSVHNGDVSSHAEESAPKSSAENIAHQSEYRGNGTISTNNFENSMPTTLECDQSSLVTENLSKQNQKEKKVRLISRGPLCAAKSLKAKVGSRRQAFQRYYLKNTQGGFHLALKNFRRAKEYKAGIELPTTTSVSRTNSKVPMKISVKTRRDPPPSCITPSLTPDHDRSFSQFIVQSKGPPAKSVVSCELPFDSSVDSGLSVDERTNPEAFTRNQIKNQAREKRDVCYVFALLDRERSETVFKCSPHLRSSEILDQLASVIHTITLDDDVMTSNNKWQKPSTNLDSPLTVKKCVDRSTSPISHSEVHIQERPASDDAHSEESSSVWEMPPSEAESSPSHLSSVKFGAEGCEKTSVTPAIKVMIVKALMTLTSQLKNPTDLSVKVLKWTSTAIKGDIDTNMCQDSFEGFLCHCHDKISIILQSCHVLDSKFIINIDEAELKNMWLLHDALCCMLQAYRYVQDLSSSPSSTLRQHLLSLMTTCAKTILPNEKISVPVWISLMAMIQGINEKLCHKDVLSKACQCDQHFISLCKHRFCRVCDLNCLYEDLCTDTEKGALSSTKKEKSDPKTSPSTVVEQLFPRFSSFLYRIENISEEEFKTAYSKHLVMKFACNSQSGLLPCREHLSEITCTCFSSSLGSGSHAEVDEAAITVGEILNQEKSGSSSSPDSGFHNLKQTGLDVDTCITTDSLDDNEIQMSDGSVGCNNLASAGSAVDVEKCQSDQESLADSTTSCDIVSVEGSTKSSDDYTLQLEASPADTAFDSSNVRVSNNAIPQSSELNQAHSSRNECSESVKVIEHNIDEAMEEKHSKNPDIDYSPLNFQLAQSSIENAYQSFDSHTSSHSRDAFNSKQSISSSIMVKCNQYFRSKSKMPVEEITLDSENSSDISAFVRENNIEETSVCESNQGSETSRLCNRGSFSDSSSVEIQKNFHLKSSCGHKVSEGSDAISLQSYLSSDSLEVLSQNEQLANNPEVSSSSIDHQVPKMKNEVDVRFSTKEKHKKLLSPPPGLIDQSGSNTKGHQKKLVSPPLCRIDESSESETSGSSDFTPKLKDEIKSLKNCTVEVQPLTKDEVHRTRSGRVSISKQKVLLSSDGTGIGQKSGNCHSGQYQNVSSKEINSLKVAGKKSRRDVSTKEEGFSQSKEVGQIEQEAGNKINHCCQTQKSVPNHIIQHNPKNQDKTSVKRTQKISSKEAKVSQESEQAGDKKDQSHPSSTTNCDIQHQNLNLQDDLVKVNNSNGNRHVRGKHLSLSRRKSKVEDVGPAQSIHNIQSRRSARVASSNPVQSQDAENQVLPSSKSKQEPLKTCASEDFVSSKCNADEIKGRSSSNCKNNSKLNDERNSESLCEVNEKQEKCSKCYDVKNEKACGLVSILKMGCAKHSESDYQRKRDILETQPGFSANCNKKVRFSSPDNCYHFIEARKELKRSARLFCPDKVTRNEVAGETSCAPDHSNSNGITVKTSAEPNNLMSLETKPVRKRQSKRTTKSEKEVVALEKGVALEEKSKDEEALLRKEAADSETKGFSAADILKNKTTPIESSVAELPIKNQKGNVKTNLSEQIPVSKAVEEHKEKSNKRKRPKKTEGEEIPINPSPSNEVIAKAPEVVERSCKVKKHKKEKSVAGTKTEKCQPNDEDNAWKKYLAELKERLQET